MMRFRRFACRHPALEAGGGGPAPGAPSGAVIDPATLERLRQLDPDGERGFVRQLLETYGRSLARQRDELAAAAASGAVQRAGEVAHALKSSSAGVGALALSELCAGVERRARHGDAGVLGEPLAALQAEAERVAAAVQAMLQN